MILSIAFTQFVFISLGILALNVLLKSGGFAANVEASFPWLAVALGRHGLWMFLVPLVWTAFAALCEHVNRGPFTPAVARATGVLLTVALFAVYAYAGSLFF